MLNINRMKTEFQLLDDSSTSFTHTEHHIPILVCWGCSHKAPQTEWLQQQKCFLSQLWRLEIHNQGGVRAVLPLEVLGKNPSSVIP